MSEHTEVFVSTDIETDGFLPGINSMLSFGSAAFSAEGRLIDTFEANLETLPAAEQNPITMKWWEQFPDAWEKTRHNPRAPEEVMPGYVRWLENLPGKPAFVGYPATFDFPFIAWYLARFAGKNPFGFAAIDIKTYAMALLRRPWFHATSKQTLPTRWFEPDLAHTHVALDDAIEQGHLFMNMRREHLSGDGGLE